MKNKNGMALAIIPIIHIVSTNSRLARFLRSLIKPYTPKANPNSGENLMKRLSANLIKPGSPKSANNLAMRKLAARKPNNPKNNDKTANNIFSFWRLITFYRSII
jgi:hypothetical protein